MSSFSLSSSPRICLLFVYIIIAHLLGCHSLASAQYVTVLHLSGSAQRRNFLNNHVKTYRNKDFTLLSYIIFTEFDRKHSNMTAFP